MIKGHCDNEFLELKNILDIKKKWRKLVRENHPDRLTAKGLPSEAIMLANNRLTKINKAWEIISKAN